MEAIWKFPLQTVDNQVISMPIGAKILSVKNQNSTRFGIHTDELCIWAICNTDDKLVNREIIIYGTGHEHEKIEGTYLGTCQQSSFVWHVFMR